MMELGKKIRHLRFKAKLTQEQLANKLGIGPQSVSKWENGASMPDITTLPLLAETFGVTIDELFDLTNDQRLSRIENSLDINEELQQDLLLCCIRSVLFLRPCTRLLFRPCRRPEGFRMLL